MNKESLAATMNFFNATTHSPLARWPQRAVLLWLVMALLAGCSKLVPKLDEVLPDRRTEYKRSKSLPDLEVPPDLTIDAIQDRMAIPQAGENATYSTFQERQAERQREQELVRSESGAIKLLENEHVLAVQGVTVQIWPQLRDFWQRLGYSLELDDEELGVIETSWNENQEDLVRDKFKIFAEPGQEPGTTLLYVSHRGEELVPQGDNLVWQARARDTTMERKVVERIETALGGYSGGADSATTAAAPTRPERAAPVARESTLPQRAELISAGGGKVYLAVAESFADAWDSTARALGKVGISVEDEDKDRGIYVVRVNEGRESDKKGMLSKLKFWGSDESRYQLSLTSVGDKTEVVVLNKEGEWETGEIAGALLTRIHNELNGQAL